MPFQPFEADLPDVLPEQLANLKETHEGWYVEYKSEFLRPRDIAKSISSFANQHGGWLFFGVQDDPDTLTAAAFPGLPDDEVPAGIESLRNASKDLLQPSVYYEHRIFPGPIPILDLPEGRSIVGVYVPKGADTPHIHNDGKIYQRIGDASQPSPVSDRATFDTLAQRGREARETLRESLERAFRVSEGESEDACYLHVFLTSDPYHMMNHRFDGGFKDFATIMASDRLPLENCYSAPGEFIARQTRDNDAYQRLLTWHFSTRCESHVTLPIPQLPSPFHEHSDWGGYELGGTFQKELLKADLADTRLLDLNMIAAYLIIVIHRHLDLVSGSGINGPFYAKARIENAWRAIPFVDSQQFLEHVGEFGLPIVQETDMLTPPGRTLDSLVLLKEMEPGASLTINAAVERTVTLMLHVFVALGVPGSVVRGFAGELLNLAEKRKNYQEHRQRP